MEPETLPEELKELILQHTNLTDAQLRLLNKDVAQKFVYEAEFLTRQIETFFGKDGARLLRRIVEARLAKTAPELEETVLSVYRLICKYYVFPGMQNPERLGPDAVQVVAVMPDYGAFNLENSTIVLCDFRGLIMWKFWEDWRLLQKYSWRPFQNVSRTLEHDWHIWELPGQSLQNQRLLEMASLNIWNWLLAYPKPKEEEQTKKWVVSVLQSSGLVETTAELRRAIEQREPLYLLYSSTGTVLTARRELAILCVKLENVIGGARNFEMAKLRFQTDDFLWVPQRVDVAHKIHRFEYLLAPEMYARISANFSDAPAAPPAERENSLFEKLKVDDREFDDL